MELLQILLLALVQGITEFLPVSSSAHLILANQLFGWADQGLVMDVAVHVGSLLAVMLYFRQDLWAMVTGRGSDEGHFPEVDPRKLLLWLVVATIPLVVAGYLLAGFVGTELRSVKVIAWASIGFGLLLALADQLRGRLAGAVQLTGGRVLAMGLAQALALIPGTSRSGITMTAGLALGLDRQSASRFAFLLAIPALAAAGTYSVWEMIRSAYHPAWADFLLAVGSSAVGAWLCIGAFLRLVDRLGMMPFVIYRILLGLAILAVT